MDVKQKILDIVRAQKLSVDDLSLWEQIVTTVPSKVLEEIYGFLEKESVKGVRFFTDDFKEKMDIIEKQDMVRWEASLQNSKAKMDALLGSE